MSSSVIPTPFVGCQPPPWASGWGQDEYGFYAEFSFSTGPMYWDLLTQRRRWIPPGTFVMGSPKGELKRFDNEHQHEVTISEGFWLADTTCRQDLWHAVMSENPSHFHGDDLPVEQVSHDDVQKFLQQLTELVPGLELELPSEAQWEYACRAGTTTPFSFGDTITTDQANFDGNYPYPGTSQGEYRESTIAVDALPPNRWGLFQMHGNVWEWCDDWFSEYDEEPKVDARGPDVGSFRVMRGGSWFHVAQYVRSACRLWIAPGYRNIHLGFRCLSSARQASQVAEQESASIGEPRDEVAEKQRTK